MTQFLKLHRLKLHYLERNFNNSRSHQLSRLPMFFSTCQDFAVRSVKERKLI